MVSDVPCQLSRSGTHAPRPRRDAGRISIGRWTAEGRRSISFWLRGEIRPRPSGSFARPWRNRMSPIREPSLSTRILPIPRAVVDMKSDGQLSRRTCLRQCKYLNNIVEQDHWRIKRLVRPGLGFGSFHTARRTLAGFETMAMMRKGQLQQIDGHDIRGQAVVIADLFDSAA